MKLKIFVFFLCAESTFTVKAQTVSVFTSVPDAKIIVDGQSLRTGNLKIKVPKNACVNFKIYKPGFLKYETKRFLVKRSKLTSVINNKKTE